jgi:hypothetical protein
MTLYYIFFSENSLLLDIGLTREIGKGNQNCAFYLSFSPPSSPQSKGSLVHVFVCMRKLNLFLITPFYFPYPLGRNVTHFIGAHPYWINCQYLPHPIHPKREKPAEFPKWSPIGLPTTRDFAHLQWSICVRACYFSIRTIFFSGLWVLYYYVKTVSSWSLVCRVHFSLGLQRFVSIPEILFYKCLSSMNWKKSSNQHDDGETFHADSTCPSGSLSADQRYISLQER